MVEGGRRWRTVEGGGLRRGRGDGRTARADCRGRRVAMGAGVVESVPPPHSKATLRRLILGVWWLLVVWLELLLQLLMLLPLAL